ncbi:hypothetical protein [Anaeromicrobium sediminis]|uniref:Lipoprotein n=1 Tax=Anaeromicrobium sediminis TaxID=1478221 RepID=A0A267MNK8_9FIRM|nr:hypothetical protein [Anaeromicrobium sediminis]PAB61126.1 hypothetical protein CCE28_01485 [Anaeromicrobium sediminis]
MKKKKITMVYVVVVLMVILCGCKSENIIGNNNASNKENTNIDIKKALMGKKWLGKRIHLEIEFMNGDYMEVENIYNNKEKTCKTRTKEGINAEFSEFSEPVAYNIRVEKFGNDNRMTMKVFDAEAENNILATNVYQYDITDNHRIYIKLLPIESIGGYFDNIELHGVEADINVSKDEFTTITTLDSKFYEDIGDANIDKIEKIVVTATRIVQE